MNDSVPPSSADSTNRSTSPAAPGAFSALSHSTQRLLIHGADDDENEDIFGHLVEDAEALIQYAANAGIEVADGVWRSVFVARGKAPGAWTQDDLSALLATLTKLSGQLKPVSAESVRTCLVKGKARKAIWTYELVAAVVTAVILPISYFSFVAAAACETIRNDIDVANALAVTLHSQIVSPTTAPGSGDAQGARRPTNAELSDLQQFAATMRDVKTRARRLAKYDWIGGDARSTAQISFRAVSGSAAEDKSPQVSDELPVPVADVSGTTIGLIKEYQNVRANAQRVQEDVSTGFGALATCFLPSLYALLGACAYLARRYEAQMKARTYTGAEKPWVRIFIAGIGGLVVGLFAKFGTGQSASLPPLAIAFLVGYGAEFFFVFLDGILKMFWRSQSDAPPDAGARGSAGPPPSQVSPRVS
jgi:hypothetical protein